MSLPTIKSLHQALKQGEFSARELAQHYLRGIENHSDLNSFISTNTDTALVQADRADQAFAANSANLLTGIPLGMKDIFCAEGTATTCASNMLRNFIAPYDATVVSKLNAAGSVTLGKTNMDEFAMGSSNENSAFGPVKNPWDTSCVPGWMKASPLPFSSNQKNNLKTGVSFKFEGWLERNTSVPGISETLCFPVFTHETSMNFQRFLSD